jgi:hypothetical protein
MWSAVRRFAASLPGIVVIATLLAASLWVSPLFTVLGLLLGIAAGYGLSMVRHFRESGPAPGPRPGVRPGGTTLKFLRAVLGLFAVVALALACFVRFAAIGHFQRPPVPTVVEVRFATVVTADPDKEQWVLDEEVTISKSAAGEIEEAIHKHSPEDPAVLDSLFADREWQAHGEQAGSVIYRRRRTVPIDSNWYESTTTNRIPVPEIKAKLLEVLPGKDSTCVLLAPERLVYKTSLSAKPAELAPRPDYERVSGSISVQDVPELKSNPYVRVEVNHPIPRRAWVIDWGFPALKYLVAALWGAIGEGLRRKYLTKATKKLMGSMGLPYSEKADKPRLPRLSFLRPRD